MKLRLLMASAGLMMAGAAFANGPAATVKADPAKGKLIAEQVCASCHGADGNSVAAANPILAGQHAEYLAKQLAEFKKGVRKNPIMLGMASNLSEADMNNVGAWFKSQKVKPRTASDKKLAAEGKRIYTGGIPAKGVPACMACHSPNGSGLPVQYPRLGSQHAGYTVAQLTAFKAGERSNDPNKMMRDIAGKMTEAEMKAVAEYISGLR